MNCGVSLYLVTFYAGLGGVMSRPNFTRCHGMRKNCNRSCIEDFHRLRLRHRIFAGQIASKARRSGLSESEAGLVR
jgi:hypothetical protein